MKKGWWFRFSFLLVLVGISVFSVIPTIFKFHEDSSYPIKSKINLGLDLQGGLYMILGIDFNKVYKDEVKAQIRKVEYVLKEADIVANMGDYDLSDIADPKMSVVIQDKSKLEAAKAKVKDFFVNSIRLTGESSEAGTLQYGLTTTIRTQIEEQAVTKSIEVIRNRIDEFGVSEPEITSQGKDRIVVQLPGVKDIDRAKELIGQTAKLEFKLVNKDVTFPTLQEWVAKAEKAGIVFDKKSSFSSYSSKLNEFLKNDLPAGYELAFQKVVNKATNELSEKIPYLVESVAKISGDDLQDAGVQIDQQKNEPYVGLEFKPQGAKQFEKITGESVGRQLAVILDGNVYTAPNIISKISGGRAQITLGAGDFNKLLKQAKDISLVLRAGALPVQLEFEEQRIVGPSLGDDSIKMAQTASIIGVGIVFLFMCFYYRISGFIAVLTLVVNVLLILGCLVAIGATLTLPGIAGIALTIGMAVDGNIIIYERIREELRATGSAFKSVEAGFGAAFWTIIDANLTTAFAGFCLLNFGTGPIKGFAVTLLIGIAATIYSCYFVSKILFELYLNSVEGRELSI
ncbi:MAG: protein translocase subunit SecD [Bacteriovoracaceae bacterium]